MTKIIGAPTLDDALAALSGQIKACEERGEKNLIFCEDRLTLLSERAVLSAVGGTLLTEVTTFARFVSGPRVLSKQGSIMEIASLIAENADRLVCFGGRAAQAVYETIAQLAASRVTPEMLLESAEETEGALKGKLNDLAFLFGKYEERLLARGLVDESGFLSLLPEKLRREGLLDTNVFFFGFRSFTRQALEGVEAALSAAKSVTGVFIAGREEFYTNESARAFRRLAEEFGGAEAVQKKSSLTGEALALCKGLFSPEALGESPLKTERVRRFTAADETEELSVVAALIKKHVAEGARYREIAVLVPDEESFSAVRRVFSAYRIPFFADQKRKFSQHPFCRFVLHALAASDSALPEEADAVASSVYFGEAGEYRNYLLKYGGYRGGFRREIKEGDAVRRFDRAALVSCRERMLKILSFFPKKGKGGSFTDGVRALFEFAEGASVTEELRGSFSGAESEFLDPTPLFSLLDEIDLLARDKSMTAREFSDLLKNGLEALEISMIPQSSDAVFVGDATESKFVRVKVLFVTGLTDALPRAAQDAAVITDGEIEKLSSLKVEIEPAIAQVNARAREGLALNLCSFTEALYLSRPLSLRGAETERSEVTLYAERLFDMPPMPALFPYDCSEPGPATLRMLLLKHAFEEGREEDGKKFSALYALLKERGVSLDKLLAKDEKEPVPEAGKLCFQSAVSPTLLESYFACPYAGFASRVLRLREREERPVLDTDAGTFVHAVLERVAPCFNDLKSEEECRALARKTGTELLSARYSALGDTRAGAYAAEKLIEEGEEVSAAAYRQLARSAFRVRETESKIALPELGLEGKTDRVDESGEFVRVIDYKTGSFDDSPTAYYTGRRLQLELYLRGAAKGGRAAGAFYFPAATSFTGEGEEKFRMSGFFSGEDEVLVRMDASLGEQQKSALFEGKRDGKYTDKGMKQEDFEAFLDYSLLIARRAEDEIRAGNVRPLPYEGACQWCKLSSLCGFVGTPRKERAIKCGEIARIVRRERGEE